jgi:hypothetical protein
MHEMSIVALPLSFYLLASRFCIITAVMRCTVSSGMLHSEMRHVGRKFREPISLDQFSVVRVRISGRLLDTDTTPA